MKTDSQGISKNRSHSSRQFLILVGCSIVVGLLPVGLSMFAPTANNSVVVTLCASAQFFVSLFAGIAWSKDQAEKDANLRWVPMAASACDRLVTTMCSICSLRISVGQACSNASKNLPELSDERNRAVRIHFEDLCGSNATRLYDVQNHLESGLADWERFIKQNCSGSECADIGRRMDELKARLGELGQNKIELGCSTKGANTSEKDVSTILPESSPILDAFNLPAIASLAITGVNTRDNRNGQWALRRITDDYWQSEIYALRRESYGWYLEEREHPESYFFRSDRSSPYGVYRRCDYCPDDGSAIVSPGDFSATTNLAKIDKGEPEKNLRPASRDSALANLSIRLDGFVQHIVHDHGKKPDLFLNALRASANFREFYKILGIQCGSILDHSALRSFNAIRDYFGLPPFIYEQELWNILCSEIPKSDAGKEKPPLTEKEREVITELNSALVQADENDDAP